MSGFKEGVHNFWEFLKKDTWQSWIVSMVIAFILIKYIFFPILSFGFATKLPIVVVESCSMYHPDDFSQWWNRNAGWYETHGMNLEKFNDFKFKNGLNKGDIVFVTGRGGYKQGDIIIFESLYRYPLIHRLVRVDPFDTKGDNNAAQLPGELDIQSNQFVGKAVGRIPALGWIKLIFFEGLKPKEQRGFCK